MISMQVSQRKKGFLPGVLILSLCLAMAFASGFALAKVSEKTRWSGRLVTFQVNPFNDEQLVYSRNIVLGLRHDGVVVWKKAEPR